MNFVVVKEHTLYELNLLKCIEIYFMAMHMIYHGDVSCKLKRNVYSAPLGILYIFLKLIWLMLFLSLLCSS